VPGSDTAKKPAYLDTAYSFRERAADLISRMTPEEKQSQLGNTILLFPVWELINTMSGVKPAWSIGQEQ